MNFSIRLRESDGVIGRKVLVAFRDELNNVLRRAAPAVRDRVALACTGLIERTPEYDSLLRGELLGDLGVPEVEVRLRTILDAIARSVDVRIVPVRIAGERLEGGLSIGMLRADFQDILALGAASYVSQPSGEVVPWLDWLIGQGDRVVVFDHRVKVAATAAERARSRTGRALMVQGGSFRVPPEFSGTFEDNFLTRAFDVPGVERMLAGAIREEIEGRIAG